MEEVECGLTPLTILLIMVLMVEVVVLEVHTIQDVRLLLVEIVYYHLILIMC